MSMFGNWLRVVGVMAEQAFLVGARTQFGQEVKLVWKGGDCIGLISCTFPAAEKMASLSKDYVMSG